MTIIPDTFTNLLDAIRAEPDADTPRLVIADWFQENGQEQRAEFIRCHVAAQGRGFLQDLSRRLTD